MARSKHERSKDPIPFDESSVTLKPKACREARNSKVGRLIIWPLLFKRQDGNFATKDIYWGVRISFPGSQNAVPIEYMINNVYLSELETEEDTLS